jgi:hypothetical protein
MPISSSSYLLFPFGDLRLWSPLIQLLSKCHESEKYLIRPWCFSGYPNMPRLTATPSPFADRGIKKSIEREDGGEFF